MNDEEKDLSFPYSRQEEGFAITLIGGDTVIKPVYCIDCQLLHPIDQEVGMNMSQALDHVNECHHPLGQGMNSRGYEHLKRNEERYRKWKVMAGEEAKKAVAAAQAKKVLSHG